MVKKKYIANKLKTREFVNVGGFYSSGIKLRKIFTGHTGQINRISWSPDGKLLASSSGDTTIRIWDIEIGESVLVLRGHHGPVWDLSWSPDGQRLASVDRDNALRIWNIKTSNPPLIVQIKKAYCVAWSPDGKKIAIGGKFVQLWKVDDWEIINEQLLNSDCKSLSWSPYQNKLLYSMDNGQIILWDTESKLDKLVLADVTVKESPINKVEWSPNQKILAAGDSSGTVQIWNIQDHKLTQLLEGHTGTVSSISFSRDGLLLASKGDDGIRIWDTNNWKLIEIIYETNKSWAADIAFHPNIMRLATLGKENNIRIWDFDLDTLSLSNNSNKTIRYATAKIILVGDSGVGKTSLGWRLTHGKYKTHSSTHGQQFWIFNDLSKRQKDGTEFEAVLWDLAGQHIYRSIHSIFLDNVNAALLLFDPSNRQDPLKGVQFWLKELKGTKKLPPTVLVGGRIDSSNLVLSQQELDLFCARNEISGGYVGTSAKTGEGLKEIINILQMQIRWGEMTATVTTLTFKRIKELVLSLKERPNKKSVLLDPNVLKTQLQKIEKRWQFTYAEMMTAVGHLQNHGYVTILQNSFGREYILLAPDLLVGLASSIILLADKNPRELGAISETELLNGKYRLDELRNLDNFEQQILLDAALLRFLEHGICFRETLANEALLIFPGLIKQKRPLQDEFEYTDDISYLVKGRVENLYSIMVVLLGYTSTFTRINQWHNQAQFETGPGEICGFRIIQDREDELELKLYYSINMPENGRTLFHGLFESILYKREVEVIRFPPVYCSLKHQIESGAVIKRTQENKNYIYCDECGEKVNIDRPATFLGPDKKQAGEIESVEAIANQRKLYETSLVRVKGYRRDRVAPICYISHANDQFRWANDFVQDLRNAGIVILEDSTKLSKGGRVLQIITPVYKKYLEESRGRLANEKKVIDSYRKKYPGSVIQIVREDVIEKVGSVNVQNPDSFDFRDDSYYTVALFDLLLNLYHIPTNLLVFSKFKTSLLEQWETTNEILKMTRTIEVKESTKKLPPVKVFVSYSHQDENYKDEFLIMLKSLERQGVLEVWHDRKIEPGAGWKQSISNAINQCDIAILFVSKYFLSSPFIQDEELPDLVNKRKEKGLRIIPIILSPCLWQKDPILKDIQALPKDGKAISSFSQAHERDQIWLEIAQIIEKAIAEKVHSIQAIIRKLEAIEIEMKRIKLWNQKQLKSEQYKYTHPFGKDQMTFLQWLQFIFIPTASISLRNYNFPFVDGLGQQAVDELDSFENASKLVEILKEFEGTIPIFKNIAGMKK